MWWVGCEGEGLGKGQAAAQRGPGAGGRWQQCVALAAGWRVLCGLVCWAACLGAWLACPHFLLAHLVTAASHPHPLLCCACCLPPLLQTADQRKELDELREMKEDVERREKAQAEVISQQVGGVGNAHSWLHALARVHAVFRPPIIPSPISALSPPSPPPPAPPAAPPPFPFPPAALLPRRPSGWRSWTACTATSPSCARRSSTRWRT